MRSQQEEWFDTLSVRLVIDRGTFITTGELVMLMMVYLSSLIVGGVLLLTQVFFGGDHDVDHDVDLAIDHDVDLAVDHDVDLDTSADIDAATGTICSDMDHDVGQSFDHASEHGGASAHAGTSDAIWLPFFSLRFWVFFATFFGLSGTVFSGFGLAGSITTLFLSVSMGMVCGWSAASVVRWLHKNETGHLLNMSNFIGQEGRVCLPFDNRTKGKIRIELDDQIRELIALHLDEDNLSRGDMITIIRIEDNVAYVSRSDRLLDK